MSYKFYNLAFLAVVLTVTFLGFYNLGVFGGIGAFVGTSVVLTFFAWRLGAQSAIDRHRKSDVDAVIRGDIFCFVCLGNLDDEHFKQVFPKAGNLTPDTCAAHEHVIRAQPDIKKVGIPGVMERGQRLLAKQTSEFMPGQESKPEILSQRQLRQLQARLVLKAFTVLFILAIVSLINMGRNGLNLLDATLLTTYILSFVALALYPVEKRDWAERQLLGFVFTILGIAPYLLGCYLVFYQGFWRLRLLSDGFQTQF